MPSFTPTRAIRALLGLAFAALAVLALDLFAVPALLDLVEPLRDLTPRFVVRFHLLFFLSCLFLAACFLWNRTGAKDLRRSLLLLDILVAFALGILLLLFSREDVLAEASPITLFTTLTLFLASVAAFSIFLRYSRPSATTSGRKPLALRLLWLAIAAAFLFASLDETLRIHEAIGEILASHLTFDRVGPFAVDDFTTLGYALGGALFVAGFLFVCFREYVRKGRCFYLLFVAAILLYGASTLLDSLELSAVPPGLDIDLIRLANSIEELFEFFAANLFLVAFLVEILEARDGACLLALEDALDLDWTRGRAARNLVLAGTALYALTLVSARVALPPRAQAYFLENDRFAFEVFADHHGGLDGVDGICFHDGFLYAANESGGSVVRIDRAGRSEILAGAADGLVSPESVIVLGERVIFTDDHLGTVFSWSDGRLTKLFGPEDGLRSPEGLAADSRGDLYVADEGTGSVYRYASGRLSVYVSALQGLVAPEEMAFDRHDNLYITDDVAGRILKVSPAGETTFFAASCAELLAPEAIHIANDIVYVTDTEAAAVFRFNLEGEGGPLLTFTSRFKQIQGIASDEKGRLYVALSNDPPLPSRILRITGSTVVAHGAARP